MASEHGEIASLLNALYRSEGAQSHLNEDDVAAMLKSGDPVMRVLIAEDASQIVGALLYYRGFDIQSTSHGFHIADMVVASSRRRNGIGKMLLCRVAEENIRTGGAWMSLTCLKENHVGNKFYQALGFQNISVQFYAIGASGMETLVNQS